MYSGFRVLIICNAGSLSHCCDLVEHISFFYYSENTLSKAKAALEDKMFDSKHFSVKYEYIMGLYGMN